MITKLQNQCEQTSLKWNSYGQKKKVLVSQGLFFRKGSGRADFIIIVKPPDGGLMVVNRLIILNFCRIFTLTMAISTKVQPNLISDADCD